MSIYTAYLLVGLSMSLAIMVYDRVIVGDYRWTTEENCTMGSLIFTILLTHFWLPMLLYIGTKETGALKE